MVSGGLAKRHSFVSGKRSRGYFIHKSWALRGKLYSEGEPFMVNGLVARRPLL